MEVAVGFRETLNKNQPLVVGVVVLATLLAAWVIFSQATGKGYTVAKTYFTVDDGATWFADDAKKAPPFMVEGKEAVRVHLYACSDGKPRAGYLEKYTQDLKQAMDAANAEQAAGKTPDTSKVDAFAGPSFRLYKKPGGKDWVLGTAATTVMSIACEDGSTPQMVR